MSNETVKGFSDYTGQEALKREKIKEILVRTFQSYGFEPAETPIVEYEEFVKGENVNDEAVSDIFKLKDKGSRDLALRYEFTFQLKRIAKNKKLPYKRYQIGEVFRDEPVSSNRFRQFTQCDVDIIGSSTRDDAEILALTSRIMNELGIKAIIYFNNRKLINEILEEQKIKEKDRSHVMREIDKLDKLPEKDILKALGKYNAEKVLQILQKPQSYFEKYNFYKEVEELEKYCKIYGIDVEFKPSLIRGLAYYNGSVFEVKTREMKETITAGGAYLVNGIQSTGISFGLERLSSLAKIKMDSKNVLVISIGKEKEAIFLAEKLREKNIPTTLLLDKGISKALEYANSYEIPFVVFVGEDEVKKGKFKLKDMKSGKEEYLSEKELIERLKN